MSSLSSPLNPWTHLQAQSKTACLWQLHSIQERGPSTFRVGPVLAPMMWCPSQRFIYTVYFEESCLVEGIKDISNGGESPVEANPLLPMSLAIHAWPKLYPPFSKTETLSLIRPVFHQPWIALQLWGPLLTYLLKQTLFLPANTILFLRGVPCLITFSGMFSTP